MENKHLILKKIRKSLLAGGFLALSLSAVDAVAQSFTADNVFVHENGEMVVFAAHTFDGTNVVETTRTGDRGYFSFGTAATWTAAANASHVDGYVRQYVNGNFVLPIGDNGAYRPIATTAGPTDAAYYAENPNGSFPVATTAADVANVSTIEYWDIDGTVATNITLTWNTTSDITTITGSDLSKLIMVGWDGSEWVKIDATVSASTLDATTSAPAFSGAAGTLTDGSITTDAAIVPDNFEAYTFAMEDGEVCLAATAFLQGALLLSSNGTMTDDLRSNSLIPTAEPYAALTGFTHVGNGGGETTTAGVLGVQTNTDDNIVDWVFIELRDATNSATVVETQSALIQRDGNIVDASDGTSNVCFSGLASNDVFVAVRHRNHLGVMANAAVTLTPAGTTVDFSTTTLHGTNATISVNSVNALWVGNTNQDGQMVYQGPGEEYSVLRDTVMNHPSNSFFGISSPTFTFTGYVIYDLNMSGTMIYQGPNENASILRDNVLNHPSNSFFGISSPTYVVDEQLP